MMTSRWIRTAVASLAISACRASPVVDLEAAALLEGEWNLALSVDPAPGLPGPEAIRGTVALLANRAGIKAPEFPGIPLNVGVHDLALGHLSPGLGGEGLPEVIGGVAGDSVVMVIGPGANHPMHLRGRFGADSIVGRWTAYQRAGPAYVGSFVMTRR